MHDPVTEAIFGELDPDDQAEFKDIGKAVKTRKVKERSAAFKHKKFRAFVAAPAKRRRTNQGGAPAKRRRTNQGGASSAAGSSAGGSAGAGAGAGAERGPRVGPVLPDLQWEDVHCDKCHDVAGQIKYHEYPGLRDPPSWILASEISWPSCDEP